MKRPAALIAVSAALLACAALAAVPAGALTIKMGSLAPTGSPWEAGLKVIAAEWARLSGNSVILQLYAGGIVGDEPDMIRKIRIGQLDAAAITVSGLNGIFSGVKALSYPLFLKTDEELSYVLGKMQPFFEREIEKRGFRVVMWAPAGWAYFYSRGPIVTPDDLKRQKLWVWVGDPDEVQAWQSSGFHVVPLPSTDIMTSLQGGMIDALIASPLLAASNQWFGIAQNQAGLRLAPMFGAAVVSNTVWAKIPRDLQPKLIEAAQKAADALVPQLVKADEDAITVMKKYGLKINPVPPAAEEEWRRFVAKGFELLIGKTFDRESLELAKGYLAEYRASHGRR
jgi:TRAP-type C4-dicarboxylate transport system substrate-binding protein